MKKILLIITLFVITLVSCKKDDPNPQPTPPAVKETPLPTVSGIYRGNNTSPIFTAEFVAIQGAGIGNFIILSTDADNPLENYVKVIFPAELQGKSLKELQSLKLKGTPKMTFISQGKTFFSGEMGLTVTSVKIEENSVGISTKNTDNKEFLIVFTVL